MGATKTRDNEMKMRKMGKSERSMKGHVQRFGEEQGKIRERGASSLTDELKLLTRLGASL